MSDLTLEEQTGWRNHLKESLEKDDKFRVLSPCDYYTYQNPAHKSEREILNWELNYVKNSDIIIVNLDKVESSVGTIMELATAHNAGKPIIGYGSLDGHHPWVQEVVWRAEETLEDLEFYVNGYFSV